jgi:hypothetical protein
MPGFLLDTNVISELTKRRPNARVVAWIDATPEDSLYLSVTTLGEVRIGIEMLDDGNPARASLQTWLEHDLRERFAGRILDFDDVVAERWGRIEAAARKRRASLPTIDAQLSATALHFGLTLATRNTADVTATGVAVFNPWAAAIPRESD